MTNFEDINATLLDIVQALDESNKIQAERNRLLKLLITDDGFINVYNNEV